MRRWLAAVLLGLLLLVQYSFFILAFVLENLSKTKMGVARYLIFKKTEFAGSLFSPELGKLYSILFIVGLVICLFIFVKRKFKNGKITPIIHAFLLNGMGIVILQIYQDLAAYHFFVMAIMIALAIQYLKLAVVFLKRT